MDEIVQNQDRRSFLKKTGAAVALVSLSSLTVKRLESIVQADLVQEEVSTKRLGMLIEINRCIGCHACVAACKAENNVPLGGYRDWVEEHETGAGEQFRPVFVPKLCNHCDNPSCLRACPTAAITKRGDGIVEINPERCIGCRACNQACPYAVPFMDTVRNVANKCNFCRQRVDEGLLPACVEICPPRCRIFGDLDDPNSDPIRLIGHQSYQVLKQDLGLGPNIVYTGLPGKLNR